MTGIASLLNCKFGYSSAKWERKSRFIRHMISALIVGLLLWSNHARASSYEASFEVCGSTRTTCVVDGDTIWFDGVKIRIADIDTPEISQPRCSYEYTLGIRARDRLLALLNQQPFELHQIGNRDEDQYGRKLRVVVQNGRSVGDVLVAEGLARTWSGRRETWCEGANE